MGGKITSARGKSKPRWVGDYLRGQPVEESPVEVRYVEPTVAPGTRARKRRRSGH